MTLLDMPRFVLLMLAPIALTANAAQDPDTIVRPEVSPVMDEGKQIGCQFGLDLQRKGGEKVSLSLNYMRVSSTVSGSALKIGYFTPGATEAQAPAAAYLLSGNGDNRPELRHSRVSDTPGFRFTVFVDGPLTHAALDTMQKSGSLRIAITLEDGRSMTFVADLGPRKDVRDAWAKCMSEAVPARD